ncbi:MAG TPA: hypothetical protein VFG73_10595 [Rhodanobacteraceae bacterium]|nr:hypothetical protein [Rhodanobacteraceae bacterium]
MLSPAFAADTADDCSDEEDAVIDAGINAAWACGFGPGAGDCDYYTAMYEAAQAAYTECAGHPLS